MYLDDLLEHLEYQCYQGEVHVSITDLVYDSRKITKGCVFVCIKGSNLDTHDYIGEAVEKGAIAIVVEKKMDYPSGLTVIYVQNTRKALAFMSAAFFGYPAKQLKTIGITGTKGKTTTTYMVKSILESTGIKTGLIGTIETIIGDKRIPANNTTPESFLLQKTFAQMVEAGCQCVVMEVSSQGLMLNRVDGFTFDYGVFTNIVPDHIGPNEHKDFADYLSCKSKLFQQCKIGLINIDDPHAHEIIQGHTCQIETYGICHQADYQASHIELVSKPGFLGIAYRVNGRNDFDVMVATPGKFSVYNSLCAIAICRHFGVEMEALKQALARVKVRGRVEMVPVSDRYTVIIDYAHNAMSLESLLSTLREYQPKRLVCLFGCGGNRAKSRRYEMGEVSSKMADLTVITSDNPRFEEPQDIINDILIGVKRGQGDYITIIDRKEAIRYCLENALDGDVIVLAGKGHENYQEIKGVKYPMDERDLIQEIISESKEMEFTS
ncbi:MAG TPA: UDP-N-acetylmuramoyl-L-alanyl-D-glutamate--2,6-diaminopimelate ligase [Clostridiales bacterium]|nr:UDP-N-acetylmuramoyl-L-alanyl-D-glutamate--2,6-diaminopimelate ligase [Clostridiales bacterium]